MGAEASRPGGWVLGGLVDVEEGEGEGGGSYLLRMTTAESSSAPSSR